MDVKEVKQYIYENNQLENVLTELGMHHIKWHNGEEYITCGMPDGDNPHSTTIYNNPSLNVVAYTRDIVDAYGVSDIISLVCFVKKLYFSYAIGWICNVVGIDYYYKPKPKDSLLTRLQNILSITKRGENQEPPLQPIDEKILAQYAKHSFQQFYDDHISDETQMEFELGADLSLDYYGFPRHRIAIPIRDENGTLVGVKGRILKNVEFNGKCIDKIREQENESKYIYMYPCAKSQILYGLYKTHPYIIESGEVIIGESEKSVMQLWSYGFKNGVGAGGHNLSPVQKEKIIRLGVNITLAYDKDVSLDEILKECKSIAPLAKSVFYIYDKNGILSDKESPMDDPEKWQQLYTQYKFRYY